MAALDPSRAAARGPSGGASARAWRAASALFFYVGQAALLGGLFLVYRLGRTLANGRQTEALHHALAVWHFERLVDLPDEATLQHLAMRSRNLLEFADRFYVTVHFPAAIAFLLWALIFQRAHWPRIRNVLLLATGAALVIHILYPLAPPRFLPTVSPNIPLVDTGVVIGPSPYSAPGASQANQYAAMPSLHIGWAILEAWAVITTVRWRARWLAIAHPVVTALVVVITANHYWLDGMIGGGLVWGSIILTRPARWDRITGVALSPARRLRAALFPGRAARPETAAVALPFAVPLATVPEQAATSPAARVIEQPTPRPAPDATADRTTDAAGDAPSPPSRPDATG